MVSSEWGPVKPIFTRQQSTDVFVLPTLRLRAKDFECCKTLRQPLENRYEGSFKFLHCKPMYYIIDKNGTNDNIIFHKSLYFIKRSVAELSLTGELLSNNTKYKLNLHSNTCSSD